MRLLGLVRPVHKAESRNSTEPGAEMGGIIVSISEITDRSIDRSSWASNLFNHTFTSRGLLDLIELWAWANKYPPKMLRNSARKIGTIIIINHRRSGDNKDTHVDRHSSVVVYRAVVDETRRHKSVVDGEVFL